MKKNHREVVGFVNGNKNGDERETVTNRVTKAMALSCAGGCCWFAKETDRKGNVALFLFVGGKKKEGRKERDPETALAEETVLLINN